VVVDVETGGASIARDVYGYAKQSILARPAHVHVSSRAVHDLLPRCEGLALDYAVNSLDVTKERIDLDHCLGLN
jgi:hypothetical protein